MIGSSKAYKLVAPNGLILAEGSKARMERLRKQAVPGHKVWLAPSRKVGDFMKRES